MKDQTKDLVGVELFFRLIPDMLVDTDVFIAERHIVTDAGGIADVGHTVDACTIQKFAGGLRGAGWNDGNVNEIRRENGGGRQSPPERTYDMFFAVKCLTMCRSVLYL